MPDIIPVADLEDLGDNMVRIWLRAKGSTPWGLSDGASPGYGAKLYVDALKTTVDGLAVTPTLDLGAAVNTVVTRGGATGYAIHTLTDFLVRLDRHCRRRSEVSGVTSLDDYLTYLNITHATKWQCLFDPNYRDLFFAIRGTYPSPENLYFEVISPTYANGLRKLVIGTGQTAGASVTTTSYCGGFPKITVSGSTGADTVTVTGTQYNPATNTATAGKTWTAAVTGDGTVALVSGGGTPADTDALITACSGITAGGSLSAGTIIVEAHRPTGRPLLP